MVYRFVYPTALNALEFIENKGSDYIIGWESKWLHTSKLKPLYTAFF